MAAAIAVFLDKLKLSLWRLLDLYKHYNKINLPYHFLNDFGYRK
jgi:hypothetical protein